MTKEVLINISGLQADVKGMESSNEAVEVFCAGYYFFKNGKHYLLMEEKEEGMAGVTKTQIKLEGSRCLEVKKKGLLNTHMRLDTAGKTETSYATPYGQMRLGIDTERIAVSESEEKLEIKAEYRLDVDGEPLSDCTIHIVVKPKK